MGCASMRWPPCCIWITRAGPANGCRTNTAAMKTWRRADDWQNFDNLRLILGYMFGMPGKKLLFMGDEFGQRNEWNHDTSLDWHLLQYASHAGIKKWVTDLNRIYGAEPALHEQDCRP